MKTTQCLKDKLLARLAEAAAIVREMECLEEQGSTCPESLFDQPELYDLSSSLEVPGAPEDGRRRRRIDDGSMTADTLARVVSKEIGRTVTRASVIEVADRLGYGRFYYFSNNPRYLAAQAETIKDVVKIVSKF